MHKNNKEAWWMSGNVANDSHQIWEFEPHLYIYVCVCVCVCV